jgi:hypothetical protein
MHDVALKIINECREQQVKYTNGEYGPLHIAVGHIPPDAAKHNAGNDR